MCPSGSDASPPEGGTVGPARERVRFVGLREEPRSGGHRHVVVELEWRDISHRGQGVSPGTLEGDLRASGEATAAAVRSIVARRATVSLLGIKAVRAFDGLVVIAAVEVRTDDRTQKLLGAQPIIEGEVDRAGVVAVLDALNRVLGPLCADAPAALQSQND